MIVCSLQPLVRDAKEENMEQELKQRPGRSHEYLLFLHGLLFMVLHNSGQPAQDWHYLQWTGDSHIN